MPRQQPVGFDHTLVIAAPQSRVVAAFFVPVALAAWWDVVRSVTTPRALGAYAVEWEDSPTQDEILGPLGGVLHGTVMDFHPRRGFFIADLYWLPPRGEPIGPMAIDVTCTIREKRPPLPGTPAFQKEAAADPGLPAPSGTFDSSLPPVQSAQLRIVQTGYEDSERWKHYYEILGAGWPTALEKLKRYLEHGKGAWDLRAF
jgi:uncharacterized protein YndB with AHSA1/START domain